MVGGGAEHDNYHEFCRLLGRLKTNYQLSELVSGRGGRSKTTTTSSAACWAG